MAKPRKPRKGIFPFEGAMRRITTMILRLDGRRNLNKKLTEPELKIMHRMYLDAKKNGRTGTEAEWLKHKATILIIEFYKYQRQWKAKG